MIDGIHGMALHAIQGNRASSQDDLRYTEPYSHCSAEVGVPLTFGRCCRGNLWNCLKEVKPLLVFDGALRFTLEPMQENRASSQFDLRFTYLFPIPAVT